MVDVVPGQYSPMGRSTERTLQRLRTQVEAEDSALSPKAKVEKKPKDPKDAKESPKADKVDLDRFRLPNKKSFGQSTTQLSNTLNTTLTTLASTNDLETTASSIDVAEPVSTPKPKLSPSFSTVGLDEGHLCEVTRAKYNRFMHPDGQTNPEAGHYRVNDSCLWLRSPQWDIGQRIPHEARQVRPCDTGMELGEVYNGFAMGLAAPGRLEPMSVSPERPDVSKLCTHPMTFAPEHQKTEWAKLDASSSASHRYPDWDFKKHMSGHHFNLKMSFPHFEPGKYDIEPKSRSITGLPFSKVIDWQMSFDASSADKLTVARCSTPSMKAALTRDRALRGARILASDPGLQRSLGIGILNAESRTGDELHDEWRWQRSDMGLAFDQMSGRPIEFSVA
ncbi:Ankyrin-1 [Durusdinium trenchii]|uniref:Ankyrin-1 n=1 Tax=Durusdinium trenchii TaxID=1381693 RepID=A0ABP0HQS9_9DINO